MDGLFTGYHATHSEFSEFDESMIGSREGSHVNSNLGFWFACIPDWIGGFGRRVLEAEIDLGRIYRLPLSGLSDLSSPGNGPEFFRDMRRRLIGEGYSSIAIVEEPGQIDMYVVLQASSIRDVRDYEPVPAPTL